MEGLSTDVAPSPPKRNPLGVCTELLDRTCGCVAYLLEEAETLRLPAADTGSPPAPASSFLPIPSHLVRSGAMSPVAAP